MIRLAPATASTARLLAAAVALALVAFVAKACDRPPTEVGSESESAGNQSASSSSAACTAPCVVVEVVKRGGGAKLPEDPHVVTLIQGGPGSIGPFPCESGNSCTVGDRTNPLVQEIDLSTGVAVFGPEQGYNLRTDAGYCAIVRPLVSSADVFGAVSSTGEPAFVYPAPVPPQPAAAAGGAVTETKKKDVPLTKQSIVDYCITMSGGAPFVVGADDIVKVTLTLKAHSTHVVNCAYYDGSGEAPVTGGSTCPAWELIDFSDVTIPWLTDLQRDLVDTHGLRLGFLVSTANANAARLQGLTPKQKYFIEVASQTEESSRQQTTFSIKDRLSPGKDETDPILAPVDPLVCEVNKEAEPFGEVTSGIDFGDVSHGHYAITPLNSALFVADRARTTIFYNYRLAGMGSSQLVTAKFRLKPNPFFLGQQPDGYPQTLSFQVTYDFSACPDTEDPLMPVSHSGPGFDALGIVVECRPDGDEVRVTWSIEIPGTRVMSFGLQSLQDVLPDPARSDDESSRVETPFPVGFDGIYGVGELFPDDCPLPNTTIGGGTNDPKWLNPIG